jgi:hypothetical protein
MVLPTALLEELPDDETTLFIANAILVLDSHVALGRPYRSLHIFVYRCSGVIQPRLVDLL